MFNIIAVVLGIASGIAAHWIFSELRKVETVATEALGRSGGTAKYVSVKKANLQFWKRARLLIPFFSIVGLLLMWWGLMTAGLTGLLSIVGFAVVGLITLLLVFECFAVVSRIRDKGKGSWNEIES